MLLFISHHVYSDCGVWDYHEAESIEDIERLLSENQVKKIFSSRDGDLYLHYVEDCCSSGIPISGTTVYQVKKDEIISHDICEASGVGTSLVTANEGDLIITLLPYCRSGNTEDECSRLTTAIAESPPIRMKWDGGVFINLNQVELINDLKAKLKTAKNRDDRESVLSLGRRIYDEIQGSDTKNRFNLKDELQIGILNYQIKRSLIFIKKMKREKAIKELNDTMSKFSLNMPGSCSKPKNEKKIAVENDIGFVFEQADSLDTALNYLVCVSRRDPERTVVYLNLFDVYRKIYLRKKKYPSSAATYLKKAKKSGKIYIELMEKKGMDRNIPKRVYEFVSIN